MRACVWVGCAWIALASTSAAVLEEGFGDDPKTTGWLIFGQAESFHWNAGQQELTITWDSAKANSYFYRALQTELTKADDFDLTFDLRLDEIAVGVNPAKPFTFEIAAGFFNIEKSTGASFIRGTGQQSPDLVEFDYFADSGFGATIAPAIVASNGREFVSSFTFPVELSVGERFQVAMQYRATNQTLRTTLLRNGEPFTPVKDVRLSASFSDFRVNAVGVCSYSDAGAGGSVRARGAVDNLKVVLPELPVRQFSGTIKPAGWQGEFLSLTNWSYVLERSADLKTWEALSAPNPGTGDVLQLRDASAMQTPVGYYRVRADRL